MLTKNQIEILNLFRKNIFLKTSILQIKKLLKKKSYQRVHEAVRELEKNKILKSEKAGNTRLISLILTPQAIFYISFLDEQEAINKNFSNYEKIMSIKEVSSYIIIITGSYAKGTQMKSSDLDLVAIIPDDQKAPDIQKLVENITFLYHPRVHPYVFTRKDFIEMLLDYKENYGKEIFRYHVILKNASIYYEIIRGAIKNGFKG